MSTRFSKTSLVRRFLTFRTNQELISSNYWHLLVFCYRLLGAWCSIVSSASYRRHPIFSCVLVSVRTFLQMHRHIISSYVLLSRIRFQVGLPEDTLFWINDYQDEEIKSKLLYVFARQQGADGLCIMSVKLVWKQSFPTEEVVQHKQMIVAKHIKFYVHVTVHLMKFLCNKTNYMH